MNQLIHGFGGPKSLPSTRRPLVAMAPLKHETSHTTGAAAHEATPFEEVVETLRGPMLRYLQRFVGDAALAEDLLQETLVRVSKGLDRFEARSSVKTWAFKIATHAAIDHLRQSKRGLRLVELDEMTVAADPGEGLGERLVIEEMNSCLREEIERLPETYRAAILLHDLEGLSAAETADIVGCSLATAKIRIHRARARLKQALLGDCNFSRDRDQVLHCDRKGPQDEGED
jgi:RNA polymerase sigma-70 factor (ECF subfamily)